ncbi:conserved hypothetical protein [Methylobacterium nodulans ORS 2060]|uniref:Uncharacterized protein n=1 Tax=Methylobacterium nodulans (strain LMG 21967 / CNCM I-2342 / ORS 2060) TaxID=460265 RepID=B8IT67_METNO|nr:conserved hypothetical protein [Methylobacterium nodulans ORS 2060]
MTKSTLLLASVAVLAATSASAQTAKEIFSYKAPSGMFSEGTTKWELFRFMHEDAERRRAISASPTATGSTQAAVPSPSDAPYMGSSGRRHQPRR